MRSGFRLLILLIVAIEGVSCGKESDASAVFANARADLRSRPSYHMSATVTADGPMARELEGTYEVDYERPDRYFTVRLVSSEELSRTIAIGSDAFGSTDGGTTWQQVSLGGDGGGGSATTQLLQLLDATCSARDNGSRIIVEVRSRNTGCEKPLVMHVELNGGTIRTVTTTIPTAMGQLAMVVRFELDGKIAPIQEPGGGEISWVAARASKGG